MRVCSGCGGEECGSLGDKIIRDQTVASVGEASVCGGMIRREDPEHRRDPHPPRISIIQIACGGFNLDHPDRVAGESSGLDQEADWIRCGPEEEGGVAEVHPFTRRQIRPERDGEARAANHHSTHVVVVVARAAAAVEREREQRERASERAREREREREREKERTTTPVPTAISRCSAFKVRRSGASAQSPCMAEGRSNPQRRHPRHILPGTRQCSAGRLPVSDPSGRARGRRVGHGRRRDECIRRCGKMQGWAQKRDGARCGQAREVEGRGSCASHVSGPEGSSREVAEEMCGVRDTAT